MVKFKLKNEDQYEMMKTTEKKSLSQDPTTNPRSNYLLNYYYDSKELYNL